MKTKAFYLYGFLGAESRYKCVKYYRINSVQFSIDYAKYLANRMVDFNPSIEEVYLMDNQYELYGNYRDAITNDSIENKVAFKDYIRSEGLRII